MESPRQEANGVTAPTSTQLNTEQGIPLSGDFMGVLERIALGIESLKPQDATQPSSPGTPTEYEALKALFYGAQNRRQDKDWFRIRAIAKRLEIAHTTLYRSPLFMFFYQAVVEQLPPEDTVKLPAGFLTSADGKVSGIEAIDD